MINWPSLFKAIHVNYSTSGKNNIIGATNVQCPWCDDHSNHCNFFPDGHVKCWRCKAGSAADGVSRLGGYAYRDALALMREHGGGDVMVPRKATKLVGKADSVELPGSDTLRDFHTAYLQGRGFDPGELKFRYGIRGTGPMETWQGIDFRLRIVIPIFDIGGRLVNFQGRDVTGKQDLRYKCCPVERSVLHHKSTLYGAHLCRNRDRIVVCEGVFDQWRLGPGSVCTFGTSTTPEQVKLLAMWPEVVLAFDAEPEAQQHAREIAVELSAMGRKVAICVPDFGKNKDGTARDPGDLTRDEADEYMRFVGVR